jgi:flagellar biosynthetic protein FlhB
MAENEDKTELATAQRRQKARDKGQIARSRELVSMATTGGVLLVLYVMGSSFMHNVTGLTSRLLGLRYGRDSMAVMRAASLEMMLILAPFLAAAFIFALFSNVLQGGLLMKPLSFSFEKLNPLTGLKNIFSISALPGVIKSFFKFVVGIILFYYAVHKSLLTIPQTADMDLTAMQTVLFKLTGKVVVYAFSTFFILAIADYLYERWKFERSIKMSKDEIRQEFRESEGDPLIKGKIKSLQRDAARRRMMEAVPRATVVITNPTHIAVALEYRKNETSAPKVVAKGKGYVAERIKELARKHGIPIVEDKPLARALVKIKLDSFIPNDLYRAVAKILSHIYRLRGAA